MLRVARLMAAPSALERGDVDGLRALVAGLGVVGHLGTLGEGLEAAGVDAGVMDEQVLAVVVRRDEAEALVVVEPLDGSGRHGAFPPLRMCTTAAEGAHATTAARNTGWPSDRSLDMIVTKRTVRGEFQGISLRHLRSATSGNL